jgi:hypothetical protein
MNATWSFSLHPLHSLRSDDDGRNKEAGIKVLQEMLREESEQVIGFWVRSSWTAQSID